MRFFSSLIGKKIAMALTGAILFLFTLVHLIGNLGLYGGSDRFNLYASKLHSFPVFLLFLRAGLVSAFFVHVFLSVGLSIREINARSIGYKIRKIREASFASRTMAITGLFFLAFLVFHLMHLTFGFFFSRDLVLVDSNGNYDAFLAVTYGLKSVHVSVLYVAAQVFLAMHLSHGLSSALQSSGLIYGLKSSFLRKGGVVFSIFVALLYISIPISVLFGFIGTSA